MNLLMLAVLGVLAWYSFENGLEFFGVLVIIAGVLFLLTGKPERSVQHGYSPALQPLVIEDDGTPGGTKEINMKVKKWKDRWSGHPNEYAFQHVGLALNNIARSFLYILGIEKDKK
ncbi:MAG: hypothetical protein QXR53_01825 [Candidatus Norongarragalinales archaeon]